MRQAEKEEMVREKTVCKQSETIHKTAAPTLCNL
jgi:hypothetical protein